MARDVVERKLRRAIATDNIGQLRVWGQRGAEVTNKKRRELRETNEYFDERAAANAAREERSRMEQANEHIVPIDPDEVKEGDD